VFFILFLLANNDSTTVDTVQTYEIPEIVMFYNGLSVVGEVFPSYYEQSVTDVLTNLPVTVLSYGFTPACAVGSRGANPYYTRIYVNGRRQRGSLTGYFNLGQLSLHSFERVGYGQSITGSELSGLNFQSMINRYDKPYSYARFSFGSFQSNAYGIDLTRAITNDLGLYASGEYSRTDGFRDQSDAERLSVYAHVYYNRFFPARLDLFYSDHDYGFPGTVHESREGRQEDRFLDISTTFALGRSVMNFFYTAQNMAYADSQNVTFTEYRMKQLGADLAYHRELLGFIIDYGVTSYFLDVDGTVTSYPDVPLDLWAQLSKDVRPVSFQVAGYFGKAGDHENFYCPSVEAAYEFFRSTQLYLSLSREARAPSDLEFHAVFDSMNPYFRIAGNEDLDPEYCWIQEAGVRSELFSIGYYRFNYDDFITVNPGPGNDYEYVNIDDWLITGCDTRFELPLRFFSNDSGKNVSLTIGGSGNIILDGDSVLYMPEYQFGGHLSVMRETSRFAFGATVRGDVYGGRVDLSGQESPGFSVVSAAGMVRFMGLSIIGRVNNILDEDYAFIPGYPMPPRNYAVSVKWEFWD
jgi:outer membrane receptor protein involved in Fe transport